MWGDILEWRLSPTTSATNFSIAVPQNGPVSWSLCDGESWITPLSCPFPTDYKAVNAWLDYTIGFYVVRLKVEMKSPDTNCPIQYKIVVPALDSNYAARGADRVTPLIAPYDYYMVDATLDVGIIDKH
jgi:hypothetical protein